MANFLDLPYLKVIPNDGRAVPVYTFWNSEIDKFYFWLRDKKTNALSEIPVLDYAEGFYISKKSKNDSTDIEDKFAFLLLNHFSRNNILKKFDAIGKDISNQLSSIHKYFLLLQYSKSVDRLLVSNLLKTEIEYAIINYRSFYDLVHSIVIELNLMYNPDRQQISDSFNKYVNKDFDFLTKKMHFPDPIAKLYVKKSEIFLMVRDLRDNIIHHGHTPDIIFVCEDGFAINLDSRFLKKLDFESIWNEETLKPNNLGSVLRFFAFLLIDMTSACEELGRAIVDSFNELPEPILNDVNVYYRSEINRHHKHIQDYYNKCWFDENEILSKF